MPRPSLLCTHCKCPGHNTLHCPVLHGPTSENRVLNWAISQLDAPEMGDITGWTAPYRVEEPKKSPKPLEGLAGCKNIWREPAASKAKKTPKALEGLAGCKNIWKESPVERKNKGNTTCKLCGCKGHNARTCPNTSKTPECVECSDKPMWLLEYKASIIQKHMRGWNIRTAQRKTEQITFANGKTINIDLGC